MRRRNDALKTYVGGQQLQNHAHLQAMRLSRSICVLGERRTPTDHSLGQQELDSAVVV